MESRRKWEAGLQPGSKSGGVGTRITLLFQKPGLWGVGRGRHAGLVSLRSFIAHAPPPSHPASRPGLCTFQKKRSERREGAGAGAKAPGAAPLTLSEDGRLRSGEVEAPLQERPCGEQRGRAGEEDRGGETEPEGGQNAGREREKVNGE